ncbi:hypothetical protein E7744_14440 [Citricoccus sp. SGAir0253]|uniref:hypothetical protein n=1 Tax=Citricoccus sp. SGAir0253 TaxID=2567881 RepID=UPI0010CCD601|nr:hypothetical protein [Citricoccus sp. SGAir0253]QCU79192.1 hypothetical protein E7744_14440 [Citricoccus sp. SGAir0253]
MGPNGAGPQWTPRDRMLLRTAQVVHAYVHGEFDQILPVAVDFAVDGTYPENRIVAVAPFRLYSYESRGDGSHAHDSRLFLAGGRTGLALTVGAAIGRSIGNARRRAEAARAAAPAWHHLDDGLLCVNQYGFYLRTPRSLVGWDWRSILECHMAAPRRVVMLGSTPAGQCTYLIESDLAELVFASWAGRRQPRHPQFLRRVWLLPDWLARYRAAYGPRAFDFTRPYPGQAGPAGW